MSEDLNQIYCGRSLDMNINGFSNKDISRQLSICEFTLRKWMKRHGYPSAFTTQREPVRRHFHELYRNGASDSDISKTTGEKIGTVVMLRLANRLHPNGNGNIKKRKELWMQGLSDKEIANRLNDERRNVYQWRSRLENSVRNENKISDKHEQLFAHYYHKGLCDAAIAARANVSRSTVWRWRNQNGFPCNTTEL